MKIDTHLRALHLERIKVHILERIATRNRVSACNRRRAARVGVQMDHAVALGRLCEDTGAVGDLVAGTEAGAVHAGVPELLPGAAPAPGGRLSEVGDGGAAVLRARAEEEGGERGKEAGGLHG